MSENLRWSKIDDFLGHFLGDCVGYAFCYLGGNFGLMMSVNYKTYVKTKILDDRYLTLIGSIGAIACSLSRILWGSIL